MNPEQRNKTRASRNFLGRLGKKKKIALSLVAVLVLCGSAAGYWTYFSQVNLSPGEKYRREMKAEYDDYKKNEQPRSDSLAAKERYYEKLIRLAYDAGEFDGAAEATQSIIDMAGAGKAPYSRYTQLITYRCQAGQTDAAVRAVDAALDQGFEGEGLQRLKDIKQQLNNEGCDQWVRVAESQ